MNASTDEETKFISGFHVDAPIAKKLIPKAILNDSLKELELEGVGVTVNTLGSA